MGESTLGTFAALQFASTIPKPLLPAELTWFLAMTEQIVAPVPEIVNGTIELPECVALASLIDWDKLREGE